MIFDLSHFSPRTRAAFFRNQGEPSQMQTWVPNFLLPNPQSMLSGKPWRPLVFVIFSASVPMNSTFEVPGHCRY